MVIFNALLNLSELKELYSGKPVCVCPLYNGVLNTSKTFEATGNPIVLPEYKSLIKLTTKFSPKQAGTGDPSPDNVRPISGWDSVKVTVSNESESHDYDITLPETIYGGTVDAVTGVGSEEWELVEFDGTESWFTWGPNSGADGVTGFYYYHSIDGDKLQIRMISSILLYDPRAYGGAVVGCSIGSLSDVNPYFIFSVSNSILSDVSSNKAAIDSWKSYLSAQVSAGTPVQVAYKLDTPKPFEISQVSIPSLGSENKFFTNGENMDIICNITSFWG